MGRLRAFLFGTLKVASALLLVVIVIGAVAWGWDSISTNIRHAKEAPLKQAKNWPPIKLEALENTQFRLVTMWRDGRIYFQFFVTGNPRAIELAQRIRNNEPFRFELNFHDKNGFKLNTVEIKIGELIGTMGADKKVTDYSFNSNTHMSSDDYESAAQWEVAWVLPRVPEADSRSDTPTMKPKADKSVSEMPKWRNTSLWRQLSKGMTGEQVQQLLGAPTKIDNAGSLTFWYYGYPLGGQVTFDNTGEIYGWREP